MIIPTAECHWRRVPLAVCPPVRSHRDDEPDTVEIVLDRPMPLGETTRFILSDGTITNEVEYTLRIPIPALSGWGFAVLSLLVLSAGIVLLKRRRTTASA